MFDYAKVELVGRLTKDYEQMPKSMHITKSWEAFSYFYHGALFKGLLFENVPHSV